MTLPDFAKPPVVEVVCGVLFDAPEFSLPHIGRFWERLEGFNRVSEVPPLAPVVETFGTRQAGTLIIEHNLLPRVWFENEAGDQLIQLQRDRLLVNWKRTAPSHQYPRYPAVKAAFDKQLAAFESFIREQLGRPIVHRQYELTYINHVPAGDGLDILADVGEVLPDLSWRTQEGRFLPRPERIEAKLAFQLPDQAGRLHVRIQNGTRNHDQVPVLLLDLTARGYLDDRGAWFDLAHEWIVNGFADLTGDKMQKQTWERRDGSA